MHFALLVSALPHPLESSAYYESLLSHGAHVAKRHGVLAACMNAVMRVLSPQGGDAPHGQGDQGGPHGPGSPCDPGSPRG
ncbi:hypothetical protein [Burkholderia guangdongensis]|uniref:hypothetical protein n=1 Tax=Burkholderia guangdongensis TaxID=1792500 RepID=UPI0015CA92D4|nr:hypothetical protein [Burkholderia guangdongensis]